MAVDTYLQIDGIKGESTDSQHKDWIEVLSFSHSVSPQASSGSAASPASASHQDFTISKYVDLASPKLYEACSSGKHIKKVVLEMMRSSGATRSTYLTVEMDDVVIASVTTAKTSEAHPINTVTFNYGKILWTYAS